ncbi:hypothetical protein [Aeromonas enteropelogenes]|uniref:hypothetical protein n=1 Tax=Aeromonas enteropelogenes TaxID=29489 RepID=UPI0038D0C726
MIDKLMAYIESENYMYALIIIVVSVAYNSFKFLDAYHAYKKRRIIDLENTIKSRHISAAFRKNIRDEIETEHFKCIYGPRVNKKCIDEIFSIYEMLKGRIAFRHFISAARLSQNIFDIGCASPKRLKPGLMEIIFGIYHLSFGFIFFFIGVFMAIYILIAVNTLSLAEMKAFVPSIFFIVTGWIMLYQGAPIYSIRLINSELRKQSSTDTQ